MYYIIIITATEFLSNKTASIIYNNFKLFVLLFSRKYVCIFNA